jgi:hypothetical protein
MDPIPFPVKTTLSDNTMNVRIIFHISPKGLQYLDHTNLFLWLFLFDEATISSIVIFELSDTLDS